MVSLAVWEKAEAGCPRSTSARGEKLKNMGRLAAPMRSYLARHRLRFHRVALFCTMGGRGGEHTLAEMADLCGKTPMARVAITDAEIRRGSYRGKLERLQNNALESS